MTGRITVTAEVVGIGSDGTEPSVVFAVHRHGVYSADKTLLQRYLFNCGEGTQRLCGENGIKLNSLDSIFLTRLDVRSASGIPGLVFALGHLGAAHLRIHGPTGTRDRLTAMESFVRRKYPKIECIEVDRSTDVDPNSPVDARREASEIAKSSWTPGSPVEDAYARIISVPVVSSASATASMCWICEKCTPLKEKPVKESIQQPTRSDNDQDPDRQWLRRFYESKALTDKIPHMDAILRRYRGRMDELKAQLTSKYGRVEGNASSSSSSSSEGEDEEEKEPTKDLFDESAPLDREWLTAFYQRFEPAKVGRVDQILRQFAGREDQLKAMLQAKYSDDNTQTENAPPVKKQKTDHDVEKQADSEKAESTMLPERFVDHEEQSSESPSTSTQLPSESLCYILQFRSPPFPVVWIIDTQTTDQVDSLSKQFVTGECGHRPVLVIHLSPPRVIHHPKYQSWIKSLGGASTIVIEHLVFDGRALRAVNGGVFSFAFATSARNCLRNEADTSLPTASRWQRLRELLASRSLGARPSLQLRIRSRFGGTPLTGEIAQAKLKYRLQDTAIADYSRTGWKYIVDKQVDEDDQDAPSTSLPSRRPQQVHPGKQLSILGTGSAAPSKLRASTSMHLSLSPGPVNGTLPGMLIDCGEGAYGQLERQFDSDSQALADRLGGLKCIWISHHHADHQCGLLRVLDEYLRVTVADTAALLFVIAPQSVLAYVKAWLPNLPSRIRLLTCAGMNDNPPDLQVLMGGFVDSMRSVRVWHCHDAYGLVVRFRDGTKLVYSGDTKPCDQLVRAGMDASLLIHEATFDDSMEEDADKKKHSTVGQAIDVARRMRAKRLVLTHFSQRYPALPPPMSSTATVGSDLTTPEIFCAFDGFTIAL